MAICITYCNIIWNILSNDDNQSITNLVYIFQQITAGLYHLHEHGIVHRDMKSLNVWLFQLSKISTSSIWSCHSSFHFHIQNQAKANAEKQT